MRKEQLLNTELLKIVSQAISQMLETDGELVKRRVKEESLNHRLAVYIENFVKRSCAYSYLSVDIE